MRKVTIIMTMILLVSVSFASSLTLVSRPTPKNKIRFTTEDSQYVSSIIVYSNIGKESVNILENHFSQERETKVVGLIWENIPEGPEVMIHVYDMENSLVADVRVSLDYFSHKGLFFYRLERLKQAVEEALGTETKISGIRQKGDNSRQKITHTESGFMILEL